MRILLTSQQISFFREKGWIEFENLLSEEECRRARLSCRLILTKRLKTTAERLIHTPLPSLFLAGRDAWIEDAYLKKVSLRRRYAELASELTSVKTLRLGVEQIVYTTSPIYPPYQQPISLEESLSIQTMQAALLLRVSFAKTEEPLELERETLNFLPKEVGNGIFFNPSLPIDWKPLFSTQGQYFLLVVYTQAQSRFFPKDKDPLASQFLKYGYAAGDLLKEPYHPILFQRQNSFL